jgi:hypothetical protein
MRMKKLAITFIVLFLASACYAQVSFDARVGANISGFSEGGLTMKFGVKAGLGIDYTLSELMGLKSGLFFSTKGASDADTPFDFSPENTLKLNYFEIPVLASFHFQVDKKIDIALNAGPSVGYRVSSKPEGMSEMNSVDVGANMGLDFVFNRKFVVGLESQYGLSELVKVSKKHNIVYSLMVGYRF